MKTKKHIITILLIILALGLVAISVGGSCVGATNGTYERSYETEWVSGEHYTLGGAMLSKHKAGSQVSFLVNPDDDEDGKYFISSVSVIAKPSNGPEYSVQTGRVGDTNKFGFQMPSAPITVSAEVKLIQLKSLQVVNLLEQTKQYEEGDTIDLTTLNVYAQYTDGTEKQVYDFTVSYGQWDYFTEAHEGRFEVHYIEGEVSLFSFGQVTLRSCTDLSVSGTLKNTQFIIGSKLNNIDGLKVTAHYSDDLTNELRLSELGVVYQNGSEFKLGDTSFQLTYKGKCVTVSGITVREYQAYEDVNASLSLVGNKPTLIVSGKLKDALSATLKINSGNILLHSQNATYKLGEITCSVDLSTALASATEDVAHSLRLYYMNNSYVDILSTMCQDPDASLKHNGKVYSLADTEGKLTVKVATVETDIDTLTLTDVDGVPTLYIAGTTTDPDLKIRITDTADFSDNVYDGMGSVSATGAFAFTYNLNNLPVSSNWYDIKVVSSTTVNIHKDELTTALTQTTFYGTETKIDVVSWNDSGEDTLSFAVSSFVVRDVDVELKSIGSPAKPYIEINGIFGDASALYIYFGTTKVGDGDLTDKTFTCLIDLTAVTGIDLGTAYYLGIATTDNATNPERLATDGDTAEIRYNDRKYSLLTDGGEYAVKVVQTVFDFNATIIDVDGNPTLEVSAHQTAFSSMVLGRIYEGQKGTADSQGIVKMTFFLSDLFVVGKAHYITITDDEGDESDLLATDVTYSGSATFEHNIKPRDDMHAINTYSFVADDGKLAIVYEQSVYKDSDDTLVATVKKIGVEDGNNFFFCYSSAEDYRGGLKNVATAEVKPFGEPTTLGDVKKRTAVIETGTWKILYTTSTLNDMDNPLSIVYDGYIDYINASDTISYHNSDGIVEVLTH